MRVLVDTGVWVSAADTDEPRHAACAGLLAQYQGDVVVPAPVVAETAWLMESRLGPVAETRFLRLVTSGELDVIDLTMDGYQRCIELIETYADMGLGLVDASIVAIGERLSLTTVATLNERDFRVVRPAHTEAFQLIP